MVSHRTTSTEEKPSKIVQMTSSCFVPLDSELLRLKLRPWQIPAGSLRTNTESIRRYIRSLPKCIVLYFIRSRRKVDPLQIMWHGNLLFLLYYYRYNTYHLQFCNCEKNFAALPITKTTRSISSPKKTKQKNRAAVTSCLFEFLRHRSYHFSCLFLLETFRSQNHVGFETNCEPVAPTWLIMHATFDFRSWIFLD